MSDTSGSAPSSGQPASKSTSQPLAALRGEPSYVWRAGQARRLAMVDRWAPLAGKRVLDMGCGMGMYTAHFLEYTPRVFGTEIEPARAQEAKRRAAGVAVAAESLPFPDGSFDVVFSHEVIEHVGDDRLAAREMVRVLAPGGRVVIFCPNRGWPFEQHGIYWRGRYHFGNFFGVNYLPDSLRNRLAPHVRVYTLRQLLGLYAGLPVRLVHHAYVAPGLDNVAARFGAPGRAAHARLMALERSPLGLFAGLSHFVVLQRL